MLPTLFIVKEGILGLAKLVKFLVQILKVLLAHQVNTGMEFNVKLNLVHRLFVKVVTDGMDTNVLDYVD
jgi:hypothetical protein